MIMTKANIKKELKKLHTLEDATNVAISNRDCVEALAVERLNRMSHILRIILKERKIVLDDLMTETLDKMESMVDEDNFLEYGWELGHINHLIHLSESLISVELFDNSL